MLKKNFEQMYKKMYMYECLPNGLPNGEVPAQESASEHWTNIRKMCWTNIKSLCKRMRGASVRIHSKQHKMLAYQMERLPPGRVQVSKKKYIGKKWTNVQQKL